jgi:hypothetical protein
MNRTDICIKEGTYRIEKNNFIILYEKKIDSFFLSVKSWENLNVKDLKDLHNLTKRILKYVKNE